MSTIIYTVILDSFKLTPLILVIMVSNRVFLKFCVECEIKWFVIITKVEQKWLEPQELELNKNKEDVIFKNENYWITKN